MVVNPDIDIESILSTSDNFRPVPQISFTTAVDDITRTVIEYEHSGTPCVITGFPTVENDEQSPFRQSEEWMESIYTNRADAHDADAGSTRSAIEATLPCPPEWAAWLRDSFIVPSCLQPYGTNDLLPDSTESSSLKLFGPEHDTPLQDDSCSTVAHDLLCVGGPDAVKHWFMTAAEDWPQVVEHLRERNGSNVMRVRCMSTQELSEAPYSIYVHTQRKGDLVILPPRSFSQTIHQGITASLCWDRMTWRGLELFVYHDKIFKQRICTKIRYRPFEILCTTVLGLYNDLQELQNAQPDDPSLSAKSETLKRGLALLDEVINSSHCLQDELLPTLSPGPEPPLCSFCGGEIFRNVFRCAESCVRDGATGDSVHCKILICSYCFIDGRACRCGSMKPYRTQPLDGLIKDRTNIANILGLSDESQGWLDPQERGVFDAAKALCDTKAEEQLVNRACSIPPAPSHRVPKFSVINCQGCHANRCYKHILSTYHVHSAQALRADRADATSAVWHNLHKRVKNTYAKNYPQLKAAIKNGLGYPIVHRLVFYAENFASNTPLNQAVALGFYDTQENVVFDPLSINMTISFRLRGVSIQAVQGVPVTSSISRSTSVSSLPEEEAGKSRRLRRRNSSFQVPSTVSEGPSAQKRKGSPLAEGTITSKRPRPSEKRDMQTMETIQEETSVPRVPGRVIPHGETRQENTLLGASSRNDAGSSKEGSTSYLRPPVLEYQRTSGKLRQDDHSSSPLHHPLEFFDPDTDLAPAVRKPGPSKPEYNSPFEQLLRVHIADVPQSGSNEAFSTEQAMIREPAPMTAPRLFPPSSLLRHNQVNQHSYASSRLESREVRTYTRLASSNTQRASSRGTRLRSTTPHQPPSTSHSTLRPSMGDATTSVFSFQIPQSYPARRAFEDDHALGSTPTGHRSDRHVAGFTPPSTATQAPAQPTRPRRSIIGNSLSLENLNKYADTLRESEKEWKAGNNSLRRDRP